MTIALAGSAVFEHIAEPAPGPTVPYTSTAGNTLIAVILCSSPQPLAGIASVTDSAGNAWQYSTAASQSPPSAAVSGPVTAGIPIFGNWVATVAWCIGAAAVTSVTVKDPTPWSATTTATGTTTQFTVSTAAAADITAGDVFSDLGPGQELEANYSVTTLGTPSGGNTPVNFTPAAPAPIASGDTLTSGLNCWYVAITEWTGISAADAGAAITGTGSPAPSLILAGSGDLIIGAACYDMAEPPAGWTMLLPGLPLAGYKLGAGPGAYSPAWTAWDTQPYAASVMSFRQIGGNVTGSWWGLDSVFKQSRQEFEAYVSRPPMACPNCGEPLTYAPATKAGSGVERYCKFDGFQYPRDWTVPSRPMPW